MKKETEGKDTSGLKLLENPVFRTKELRLKEHITRRAEDLFSARRVIRKLPELVVRSEG